MSSYSSSSSGVSAAHTSLTSSPLSSTLDSPTHNAAASSVLRDSFFPAWKDDASGPEMDSPEEMQKKDPLGRYLSHVFYPSPLGPSLTSFFLIRYCNMEGILSPFTIVRLRSGALVASSLMIRCSCIAAPRVSFLIKSAWTTCHGA